MNLDKKQYPYFFVAILTLSVIASGAFFYFKEDNASVSGNGDIEELKKYNENVVKTVSDNESPQKSLAAKESDFFLGAIEAELEMIVYDDPSEPFAPQYYETIKKVESEYGDNLKIVLRLLPLKVNDNSDFYSLAVLCAGEQGKYFEVYEALLQANKEKSLTSASLSSILEGLGLDMEKIEVCKNSGTAMSILNEIKKEADDMAIIGVPSTFIGGYPFPGAYQFEDFTDSAGYEREGLKSAINRLTK